MSILSNSFPEILAELNADPDRPDDGQPTEDEINAMAEYHGAVAADAPAWADEIINIVPEDASVSGPAADRQSSAPTNARQARKPRQKPARSVRLLSRTHGMYELPDTATVEITLTTTGPRIGTRTDCFRYTVVPIPADFGRGFQVTREDTGDTYAVNLNGRQSTCECAGHLKWGNCKHVPALQTLVDLGRL